LMKEKREFMERLENERTARTQLETWASTRIQSVTRGFLARPKKQRIFRLAARSDKETIRAQLEILTQEMDRQLELESQQNEDETPEWRRRIQRKAAGKKHMRKMQTIGNSAALKIQTVVLGFMARRAVQALRTREEDEQRKWAAMKMQSCQRGYLIRAKMCLSRIQKRHKAAVRIQAVSRAMLDKEYARVLRLLMREKAREDVGATMIQGIFRQRMARRQMNSAKQNEAARRLQSKGREWGERKRTQKANNEKKVAATKLQAQIRGKQARATAD